MSARGDERLSGRTKGDSPGADSRSNTGSKSVDKSAGGRPSDRGSSSVGRALRTIYDDTLREPVPDDFSDLLGKLN